jgi:hypothetical protein
MHALIFLICMHSVVYKVIAMFLLKVWHQLKCSLTVLAYMKEEIACMLNYSSLTFSVICMQAWYYSCGLHGHGKHCMHMSLVDSSMEPAALRACMYKSSLTSSFICI